MPIEQTKPLLQAIGISKSFLFKGAVTTVLNNVSFQIGEGEFVSIVGSSGCGKSTFLELLAGITKPDRGQIILSGQDITGKPGNLGFMPQDDLLFPWLTTLQNILLPARVRNKNLKQARIEAEKLLPIFGLQEHKEHLPYQLSGGLRQRVALLRTYMFGAKILLLDEPLANLDALTRTGLQDWLRDIVDLLHLTVILVTHDIDEAIVLSNRIELMAKNPGTFIHSFSIQKHKPLSDNAHLELKRKIRSLLE